MKNVALSAHLCPRRLRSRNHTLHTLKLNTVRGFDVSESIKKCLPWFPQDYNGRGCHKKLIIFRSAISCLSSLITFKFCIKHYLYRADGVDGPQEMEIN